MPSELFSRAQKRLENYTNARKELTAVQERLHFTRLNVVHGNFRSFPGVISTNMADGESVVLRVKRPGQSEPLDLTFTNE